MNQNRGHFFIAASVFALAVMPIAVWGDIYLDPAGGDDSSDGASSSSAVKTFARARELADGGTVRLLGTISVSSDATFDLDGGTLLRDPSNTADMFGCTARGATLSFSNITIDGGGTDTAVAGRLVSAQNSDVELGSGAVLRRSFSDAAPAGVLCANLTMSSDSRIELCRLDTNSKSNNGGRNSAAGAKCSGHLSMTGNAAIRWCTNLVHTGGSVASQIVGGGAHAATLSMDGNASIYGNWSRAQNSTSAVGLGGAGAYIGGSGVSTMAGNASIRENCANWQKGCGLAIPNGILVMKDNASIVSNLGGNFTGTNNQSCPALYGGTLVMSNNACIVRNGYRNDTTPARCDSGEGSVCVDTLEMHDDSLIAGNCARAIGGVLVRNGGIMDGRSRIASCTNLYVGAYSCNAGVMVTGGTFTMTDEAVIEDIPLVGATKAAAGIGVCGTGIFAMEAGTIRGCGGGIVVSMVENGGTVLLSGGSVTNNFTFGVQNGSIPYTGKEKAGGLCTMSGGLIADNGGYGFTDVIGCISTNRYTGGTVRGNAVAGARSLNAASAIFVSGEPDFRQPFVLTSREQRFVIDGKLRHGASLPLVVKALSSKNVEIDLLTPANQYGLDMDEDGTMSPLVVAVPDGVNVADASRFAKFFSLANTLPTGTERYINDIGAGLLGISDRRPLVILPTVFSVQ